ncbi:putative ribonuclease H-like domain-containing protein [Tanacetum coccineum]|uniref:Ribonuclease H-like domain-containing protein n=1 Tax=Tanacetum coccineum TaxID=301880 RepID=A0ABQ4ZD90_9ASTR
MCSFASSLSEPLNVFSRIPVQVLYNRYIVSNGGGYAVLIIWIEYDVLDGKLDTPYTAEVDTPYSAIDQNSLQDYALWEVIKNGNSFKPKTLVSANTDGTSTLTISGPVTTEKKIQKRNDVKARSILLMALPNENQLTFNQHKDAKTLFEAIQSRFCSNDATKKTQKTSSSESLDSIFNRLQKIVKRSVSSSSNSGSQNMAFVSTPGSTNEDTAYVQVSTASAASTNDNAASLSNAIVYAFLANQPNGSQLAHEDLEQIHDDDLKEMDLKWQLTLLSMRARKFYQRARKKITINGGDTAGFDKTKGPRSYDQGSRSQDNLRRTVKIEDTSSKAMVAIDGAGFNWSCMAEEEVPTNMALMAFSDSKVYNDKTCSNTCLKSFETLKTQYDNLRIEFNKYEFDLANYKRGLASIEEQLFFYKKNEVMFTDQIVVLKRDASFNESEIIALKIQIEKLKKDKEDNLIKIDNYENASKSLDKLIGSQLTDNNRKCVGYNAVPPPPTGLFAPPTIDLSSSGLKEFKQQFEGYSVKVNKSACENSSTKIKKTLDAPIIEDWVSDSDEDESEEIVTKKVQHKPEQDNKPRNVRQNPRYNSAKRNEMKTQRLGVGFQFSPKACFVCGSFSHLIKDCDFYDKKVVQKPVLNNVQKGTGQMEGRPVWNNSLRTNHQNFSNSRRNFTPTVVLTKSGKVPIDTARQSSSRAAVPVSIAKPINTVAPKSFVNINSVNTAKTKQVKIAVGKQGINVVKPSASWVWRPKSNVIDHISKTNGSYICSSKGGRITGKGNIRTENLDFEDVCFVKELKFNLFSVLQMCDKKNNVLFTETECLILSPDFKLPDENQVMLKIPRKDNMYSFDLKNIVPSKGLTCLIAKATNDESKLWHRRLGHINFKTMNKLVKGNLVRGLPSKIFENDYTCVACQKGKQHKATCKSKLVNTISQPLQVLHMDLFGPTFVKSIMGKMYCLVITDDYSRFSWVFFLAKKDETSGILKNFITGIENQLNYKVKVIRCDNGTEFKNYEMSQFCGIKGIKNEFSNARTPQQNGVAERKNRTLIEAARTMLADSLLPIPFWAEPVNTACYVQNKVLVTKPHSKTPYELLLRRTPTMSFMRPFGCLVTILNTLDHLGKFDGKADKGVLVGYSINSKAFRVYNHRTMIVEENLHVNFLENKSNIAGNRLEWLFDIDSLTNTMNYQPVSAGNRTNGNAGIESNFDARQAGKEKVTDQEYILLPMMHTSSYVPLSPEEDVSSLNDDAADKKTEQDSAIKKSPNLDE